MKYLSIAVLVAMSLMPAFGQNAYVANYSSGTLSIINTATGVITGSISVGSSPGNVIVTPDGTLAYVTNYTSPGSVSVVNTSTNAVIATIAVGNNPGGIAVQPDSSKVYVCNFTDSTVSVIQTSTNTVIATIPVSHGCDQLGIASNNGSWLYATNYSNGSSGVSVINTATNAVTGFMSSPGSYYSDITIQPNGQTAYVVSGSNLLAFNLVSDSYTATYSLDFSGLGECTSAVISPDGSTIYSGCGAGTDGSIQVFDTASNGVAGSISASTEVLGMALTTDATQLYAAVPDNNEVLVVSTATNSVVTTISGLGPNPVAVGIQPPSAPLQSAELLGPNGCGCVGTTGAVGVGEPIDVASGNMAYELNDYTTAGQNALAFSRYYNSRGTASGITTFASSLGIGWRSTFDRYLQINSSSQVIAERASGQQFAFTLSGSTWTPNSDVDITLTHSGSTWTLTDHDDTVETYTTTSLGNEALLNSIQSRNGYAQTLSYNGSNQLTGVSDSYSRSLALNYNSNGTLHTVATPDSTTLTYGYTAGGAGLNLTSVTYPTSPSSVLTYTYGESGAPPNALTGIIDEDSSRYATWTYDGFSRGTSSELGTGSNAELTSVSYNSNGTTTVTNAFGVQDTYSFMTLQNVPKVSGVSRAATSTTAAANRSFTYDSNGYLATETDWNGNQTTYTNNSHGKPTKIVEPTRTTTISYDPTWVHLPHQIVTTGLTTTFVYDSNGNPHTRTDKDTTSQSVPYSTNGETRVWTYNYANFLLTSVQNPRTDQTIVTQYGYGPDGALTSITDALTHVTNITQHTGGGRPLTIVDPNNVTTTVTYDQRQRLTTSAVTTSQGVLTTTYTIDPTGELKELQLPDGSTLTYAYDTAHRLTQATDTQNNYAQYTPDALGDLTAINIYNNAGGLRYQHSATFDALGRILTDVGGAGQTTTYSNYDNNGNPQTITDPLTNPSTQLFDTLNRLTQVTDANSGITKWSYDTHNRTTKVTDANSHATSYVRDGFGDVIQQTSPDSGVTVYYFDGDGNITKKVDALSITTNMTYDQLDRIATRSYPADSTQFVGYEYDQNSGIFGFGVGRLTTMTDPMGTHNLQYDERGNIVAHRRFTNPGNTNLGSIFFAYDLASRISNITYPSGMTLYYDRDSVGHIYKVTLTAPGSSTQQTVAFAAYKPFGPLYSLTFGNNESENLQFDNDYRMLEATDTNSSSVNLMDQVYGYDAADNLKTLTDNVNSANNQTLGYDVINRLHTASGNYGSYTWTLDKVGNLKTVKVGTVTTTYTLTTGTNEIATIKVGSNPAVTVATNANGNITSIPPANSSTAATFTYDVTNRLSGVSGSPTAATFLYDAFGERYSKTNPGSSPTTYAYDFSGNLLEENISGSVTDYIYLNGIPLSVFLPGGTSGTVYFVHADRQGTPQLVTNSAQAGVWSTTYQPYGTTPTIVSSIVQNLRFPGQHFDLETGFHYNNARDYMPNLGRYLEFDPMALGSGPNPYLYAHANPGLRADLRGLQDQGQSTNYETEIDYMNQAYGPSMVLPSSDVPLNNPSPSMSSQDVIDSLNALGDYGSFMSILAPPPYNVYLAVSAAFCKIPRDTQGGLLEADTNLVIDSLAGMADLGDVKDAVMSPINLYRDTHPDSQ